jgi:hypothetical protein
MAELTQHEWRLLDEAQASRTQQLRESLEKIGVQFRIAHFTGDSSYPTEYTLTYGPVQAVGPTFDLTVAEFIEKLLKHVPVEQQALELESGAARYNREIDERNRLSRENVEKPWLPLHDGE